MLLIKEPEKSILQINNLIIEIINFQKISVVFFQLTYILAQNVGDIVNVDLFVR